MDINLTAGIAIDEKRLKEVTIDKEGKEKVFTHNQRGLWLANTDGAKPMTNMEMFNILREHNDRVEVTWDKEDKVKVKIII